MSLISIPSLYPRSTHPVPGHCTTATYKRPNNQRTASNSSVETSPEFVLGYVLTSERQNVLKSVSYKPESWYCFKGPTTG